MATTEVLNVAPKSMKESALFEKLIMIICNSRKDTTQSLTIGARTPEIPCRPLVKKKLKRH